MWKLNPFFFLKSLILKKPFAAGIEITNRCNLRCPMCYWLKERPKKELTEEEMISLFKRLRRQGIIQVTLVGGEPTLRPSIIRASSQIFPYTAVVTNGSFSDTNSPPLMNTLYVVSVDGTEEIHDKIRTKGLYKTIWKNFSSRSDCFIAVTLTKTNKDEIEPLIKEWLHTKILGITFDFATPVGKKDNLWINWEERDKIIDKLLALKEKYGDFILLSNKMLNLLRRDAVQEWSKNCPLSWMSISYTADGAIKKPCIIGKNADCSRCGCHLPPMLKALIQFDQETSLGMRRILIANRKLWASNKLK